jgi:hypothetical protein
LECPFGVDIPRVFAFTTIEHVFKRIRSPRSILSAGAETERTIAASAALVFPVSAHTTFRRLAQAMERFLPLAENSDCPQSKTARPQYLRPGGAIAGLLRAGNLIAGPGLRFDCSKGIETARKRRDRVLTPARQIRLRHGAAALHRM